MGFLFGIPSKLIKRITEIEIDTHYYDKDVVPSNQDLFTYSISRFGVKDEATITGFKSSGVTSAVIPYRIKFGDDTSNMYANVTKLDKAAFKNYKSIASITIPNTIHEIPNELFSGCSSLDVVNIPKSVKKIGDNAFANCIELDSLFIPSNVKEISNNAFSGCSSLHIICYKGTKAETFAKENNIPYSLISYTLDDDIKENSPNLVTSGVIWNHIQNLSNRITTHINDILNPHKTTKAQVGLSEVDNTSDKDKPLSDAAIAEFEKTNSNLLDHIDDKNNPHDVTKTQVGLSNVDNTSDLDKPLSTATIDEFNKTNKNISDHINNTLNPHDDSTFNNSSLVGNTSIEQGTLNTVIESNNNSLVNLKYLKDAIDDIDITNNDSNLADGYQKQYDSSLETDNKTVVGAINEINHTVNTVCGKLVAGWNTVSLNMLYPINWTFLNKPYCYTDDGLDVDYRIKDLSLVENDMNAFNIYVPIDCNYTLSTTNNNFISGIPIDYLIFKYYYTGADGKDLDTVTELTNSWDISRNTIGYGHRPNEPITDNNGVTLIQFSGDNRGGGDGAENLYYECVYFDIKHLQEHIPNEDVEIILYGAWCDYVLHGHINISLECYANDTTPEVIDLGDTLSLRVNGVELDKTYENNSTMECNIVSTLNKDSSAHTNYKSKYTPVFKLIFHKTIQGSNHRTISIQPLS